MHSTSSLSSPQKPKVALGMSGGVDSSLCAHLLVEQGYDVTGVYLECWRAPGCRTEEDRKDALAVALALNIPFTVLDFKEAYREKVVENFFAEYAAGRTPNPDVLCNKEIKFGLFYDWAVEHGFEYVATGHYASITLDTLGTPYLAIPSDTKKDQTYFLYLLQQHQLQHILFPLAHITKSEVRAEAAARKLPVAQKKDSVGICFIGDINVHEFLRERLGENPGDVVDTAGRVIGRHTGLWFYTVGQRHGFTVAAKTVIAQDDGSTIDRQNIPPFYVIAKKPEHNQLVVGFGSETLKQSFSVALQQSTPLLLPSSSETKNPNTESPNQDAGCFVRIRHTGQLLPCSIQLESPKTATQPMAESPVLVTLEEGAAGVAEGQSAVFYVPTQTATGQTQMVVAGGGVISSN